MKDTFDIGVALAIGFVVGTYFGVWLLDAFRAYRAENPVATHSWQLSPDPARCTDQLAPERRPVDPSSDDVPYAVFAQQTSD